jgi:hypothetical protein
MEAMVASAAITCWDCGTRGNFSQFREEGDGERKRWRGGERKRERAKLIFRS